MSTLVGRIARWVADTVGENPDSDAADGVTVQMVFEKMIRERFPEIDALSARLTPPAEIVRYAIGVTFWEENSAALMEQRADGEYVRYEDHATAALALRLELYDANCKVDEAAEALAASEAKRKEVEDALRRVTESLESAKASTTNENLLKLGNLPTDPWGKPRLPMRALEDFIDAVVDVRARTDTGAGTADADAGAKALAEWFRYSWDGVSDRDISDRFPDFTELPKFQGGKPALRKMAARISKPFADRIADLEQRLAEAVAYQSKLVTAINEDATRAEAAERERDAARTSLEAMERRVGEAAGLLKRVFAWTTAAREGIKTDRDPTFSLKNLERFEEQTRQFIAALTPDAGAARSNDEET